MRIGPMVPTDFAKLKEKLDLAKLGYAVNFDQEIKENPAALKPSHDLNVYPTFQGIKPYIYMELEPEALLLLKADLEKMGFDVVQRDRSVPEKNEYHCTECEYTSEWPGQCPTHLTTLLEFVAWNAARRARAEAQWRKIALVATILIVIGIGCFIYLDH